MLLLLLMNERGEEGGGALGEEGGAGDEGSGGSGEGGSGEGGSDGASGGESDAPPADSIYGDLSVAWPEGLEDALKNEPSLKPFVNKEGAINTASLLKSYHETKKSFGKGKEILPDETFDAERTKQFWGKLGAKESADQYEINQVEGTLLEEKFVTDMKNFAVENNVPNVIMQKMSDFMETQSVEAQASGKAAHEAGITAGLDTVKKEYGAAYDNNLVLAKRVIKEVGGLGEEDAKVFSNPAIGSNPAIIRALVNIGKKLYSEDSIQGDNNNGMMSPEQAQQEISKIYDDKAHPFNNPSAHGHNDAQKHMLKLFNMKRGLSA